MSLPITFSCRCCGQHFETCGYVPGSLRCGGYGQPHYEPTQAQGLGATRYIIEQTWWPPVSRAIIEADTPKEFDEAGKSELGKKLGWGSIGLLALGALAGIGLLLASRPSPTA